VQLLTNPMTEQSYTTQERQLRLALFSKLGAAIYCEWAATSTQLCCTCQQAVVLLQQFIIHHQIYYICFLRHLKMPLHSINN